MRSLRNLLVVTVLFLPAAAAAQGRDFSALRDTLARETSSYALRERIRAHAAGPNAHDPVERGFLLHRLYQLTSDESLARDARQAFEDAVRADPASPWAHYGLAVALAEGPEIRGPGFLRGVTVRQMVAEIAGNDPRSKAKESLQRALEVDSSFTPAALELAELALETRERGELFVAREALVGLPPASISTLQASLALADVEAALGNLEAAEKAATRALESPDATRDAAAVRHTQAVTLLRQGGREHEGSAAYFAGIDELTDASAGLYYDPAEWIATDVEQARWKMAELDGRKAWLREFWALRAAQSGLTVERRLAEHYRRLAVAQSRYVRTQRRGAPPTSALLYERAEERPLFDDRGLVYIRYGEPDEMVATTGEGLRPNESWLYHMPDGELRYFHFAALRNGHDFALIDDLFSIIENQTEIESAIALFEDRLDFDKRYQLYVTRLRAAQSLASPDNAVADRLRTLERSYQGERGRYRMNVLAALEQEHATPDFERELPFYYDIYSFRGEQDRTALTATFAVPGNLIEPTVIDGRTVYPLQASFIVIDTVQRRVERVDTTFRFAAPRRLAAGEHIRFDLQLPAQPSRTTTHRVLVRNTMRAGEGQMYGGPVDVSDYAGTDLRISEIVLARTAADGSWERGNARLALLPPRQFEADDPFRVFYEIYNLGDDAAYRTEILVEPTEGGGLIGAIKGLFGAGRGKVNLQFEDVARDERYLGGVQELRDLAADFEPGRYRITIRITETATGRTASRERMFIVIPPVEQD